jgi:hypothetical protein
MKSLQDIETEVAALAARIDAPAPWLPTCGRSEDGARPHIEVHGGAYHYVIVERGGELERFTTPDDRELLYRVFRDLTHAVAFAYEMQHRVPGQDCRRLAFAKQVEAMASIDGGFAARLGREIEATLQRAPYRDEAMRGAIR